MLAKSSMQQQNKIAMKWDNQLTKMFNVRYPVIQAPMFGVTTPAMTAAAAKAEVLGSLSLGDLSAKACIDAIRNTRTLTDKPFAVNLFVYDIPPLTDDLKARYARAKQHIQELADKHKIKAALPDIEGISLTDYHDQVDAVIEEGCKIVSFTFGNLDNASIDKLKQNGIVLIGTCTSVDEAKILEESGIDVICVQGIEAGGHRGSFAPGNIKQIGGLSLLPQVFDTVKVPLIYAGGIYNAATLLAAKTLGAQGFQIGSLLLGSSESALQDFEKQRLRTVTEKEIVLTKSFTGRYARGINNTFIKAVDDSEHILPYPYQNKLTADLRKVAKSDHNSEFVSIWMGQSINSFSNASTLDIIKELITAVEALA